MTTDRIVVGVDGSAPSLDALRWATREAVSREVPMMLVTSTLFVPGSYADGVGPRVGIMADQEIEAKGVLAEALDVVHEVAGDRLPVPDTLLAHGPASNALMSVAETACMIVVGSRGLGAYKGELIGSISTSVATHAPCPVAVVQCGASSTGPVVVGVDCTATSRPALGFAFHEASLRGVDLVAVHAWSDVELTAMFFLEIEGQWFDSEIAEKAALTEVLTEWTVRYPSVTVHSVVAEDRPVREIVREAVGAQLVVVGSRGRGGFVSLLLGSTSRAVLHSVDVPVVIVPTDRPTEGAS